MSNVSDLATRIEGAFTTVKDKIKKEQQQLLKEHQERQKNLKQYEEVQTKIVEIAKPRLELLAKRAGERVSVKPAVTKTRRSATFEFRSPKAYITLMFAVAPDMEVKNAVVECDLKIVPVLWRFDAHSDFSTSIANPDLNALSKWLDDRIVSFVELYIKIHEGEFFDKAEYVEDPIAKVKFPKFAAAATLEHGGQTYFFIDDTTRGEFATQQKIPVS
jgi:YHS domain-containing protein